jgi:hypothetical protein
MTITKNLLPFLFGGTLLLIITTVPTTEAQPTRTFQSTDEDSFRVQIPEGWIIQDIDNTGSALLEESTQGYGILAQLCPGELQGGEVLLPNPSDSSTNTVSSIDASRCLGAQDVIHIIRYLDLDTRLGISSEDITTTDGVMTTTTDNILSYHLQKLQEVGYSSMDIVNATDMTVELSNPQTNQTVAILPAKFVEMTYSTNFTPNVMSRGYFVLTATNATSPNIGTTKGYSLFYEGSSTTLPPAVKQVFDSFELMTAPPTRESAPTPPPTTETQQQEQQPQGLVEEQSPTAEVQQPLTVAVDRPSYSTGDTITITGTVAEREPGSDVLVEVTDPQGNQDWLESATVTADNTYQVEIEAGEPQYRFSEDVMDTSGTYLVTAGYFTPEPNRDVVRAETTFEFTAED